MIHRILPKKDQGISAIALLTLAGHTGLSLPPVAWAQRVQLCAIEPTSKISSVNQKSRCILRTVLKGAEIGPNRSSLPETFAAMMATGSLSITQDQLRQYLKKKGIGESEIGGSLDTGVSRANDNADNAVH